MNRDAKIYFAALLCVALAAAPFAYPAQQTINATDSLPTSRPKINDNFTELYTGMNGTRSVATGGTGQTSYTNGQLLIGNTTGNTLAKGTLTGTPNEITITNGGGSITLSLPTALDFTGKEITSGTFVDGAYTNIGVDGATISSLTLGNAATIFSAAAPTTTAAQIAFDNNAWAASRGAAQLHDGTANTYLLGVLASDTPSNGQVPQWNTGGTITWETPAGGASLTSTLVGYGSGANALTGEAAFSYDASTNTLTVDNLAGVDAIDGTTETTLEAALELASLQGAATDGQIPNNITIDLATLATTATTANAVANNSVTGAGIALASQAAGDIMYYDGTDWVRLAKGTAGQVLEMNAGATAPEWDTDDNAGSNTTIDALGDAAGDGSIAIGAHEIDFTSTIDASGEAVFTLTNTDADAANDNSLWDLRHNDGADANVFYARFIGDNDGTPVNDYLFSQTAFTVGSGVTATFAGTVNLNGTTNATTLNATTVQPTTDDGAALGSTSNKFSDLFLASGAVVNFNSGNLTLTHSAGVLTSNGAYVGTTATLGSTTSLLLGTAGSAVGNIGFRNATSGTITLAPPTGALGTVTVTLPNAASTLPIFGQQITFAGPTAARTVTLPDANFTVARTDAANTFTGVQTMTSPVLVTPAAFTTGGDITQAEGHTVALDPVPSADGTHTGITVTGTAGATLAYGDLIVLDVTDSRWKLADANSASGADGDSRGMIGICVLAAASDGSATEILLQGIVRADTAFPTFTVNSPVYVSETAGDATNTSPTTEDNVVRPIGTAFTADSIYFNPAPTWVIYDAP